MKQVAQNENSSLQQQAIEEKEKALFEQIHQMIMDRKLFLDPLFSREKYIKLGLINKNKVAYLLQRYAKTNLNGYINSLRLDYAIQLMQDNPEAPMKAIAIDSGFKHIRTFYRQFLARYGVTPSGYKIHYETTNS